MLRKGFPKACNQENMLRCYSWLRLKEYANEESTLDKVLGSKENFHYKVDSKYWIVQR